MQHAVGAVCVFNVQMGDKIVNMVKCWGIFEENSNAIYKTRD